MLPRSQARGDIGVGGELELGQVSHLAHDVLDVDIHDVINRGGVGRVATLRGRERWVRGSGRHSEREEHRNMIFEDSSQVFSGEPLTLFLRTIRDRSLSHREFEGQR